MSELNLELTLPTPTLKEVREDQFMFVWRDGSGPEVMGGYSTKRYPVRLTSLYARFTPDGELIAVSVGCKKIRKDGTTSQITGHIPYSDTQFHDLLKAWRARQ